jgi:transcriptional regulator GlxA family with amidase domain
MRIDIPVYEGLDELDALAPLEVLRNAERMGADFSTRLLTRTPAEAVTGSHRVGFFCDGVFEPGAADLVLVPGGGWAGRPEVGAWGEVQRGDWLPLLAQAAGSGSIMAAVCTGTMLLAHAGVVGTRRAATHHAAWGDLAATGATVVKDRVVDDGTLITCGGVTAGLDLALWIVERFDSAERAEEIGVIMEYPRSRPTTGC